MMKYLLMILLFFSTPLLISCDQDPFGMSYKRLPGEFYLHRWEDGNTYYLDDNKVQRSGGGIIDGTVEKIGWNKDYILIKKNPLYKEDDKVWVIINIKNKEIRKSYMDDIIALSESQGITVMLVDEAWSSGSWSE